MQHQPWHDQQQEEGHGHHENPEFGRHVGQPPKPAEALPGASVTVLRAKQITGAAEASPDLSHDWAGAYADTLPLSELFQQAAYQGVPLARTEA